MHVSAAFSGLVIPFVDEVGFDSTPSFEYQYHTMSVSCHKSLGVEPCPIFLARRELLIGQYHEVVGSNDPTLSCSRNGHTIFKVWAMLRYIAGEGRAHWARMWESCYRLANFIEHDLCARGVANVNRNVSALTATFPKPQDPILIKK